MRPPRRSARSLLVLACAASLAAVGAAPTIAGAPPATAIVRSDASAGAVVDPAVDATLQSAPPDAQIAVIVRMRDQVDVRSIGGSGRAHATALVTALRQRASATQGGLRALLGARTAAGRAGSVTPLWIINGIAVHLRPSVIAEIAARPEVASITPDELINAPTSTLTGLTTPVEPNVALVNAPALWNLGFRGQGVVVASMDTGVDATHPDLSSAYRGGTDSWYDPYGQHPTLPTDVSGHGTSSMGLIVGGSAGGSAIGVAPAAKWIAAKIFNDSGTATTSAIHLAYQWLLDPDGNPATADAPNVVNNSWTQSNPGCSLEFEPDLASLVAADIVPVFAAGNFGPSSPSSASPANNPGAFAVGTTDNADTIASFSGRGPTSCGRSVAATFPDVVAPGVAVQTTDLFGLYNTVSGTSFSAPSVSGVLALLRSAFPAATMAALRAAVAGSAVDLGPAGPDATFGAGRIDALAAYNLLASSPAPTPTPTPLPTPTPTPAPTPTPTPLPTPTPTPAPTPTPTPTPAPTPTPTPAPTPTPTPLPTPTPTPLPTPTPTPLPTPTPTPTPPPVACTTSVAVPALAKGTGYWTVYTTAGTGTLSATWSGAKGTQLRLALYAGTPFAARTDPVKLAPPSGAIASASSSGAALNVSTAARPAGTYTAYFYAPSGRPASAGSTTGLQRTCTQ